MAKLVALHGVSGSGKAAVAKRLVEHHGFTCLRFGDPIRDMLRAGFGFTEQELDHRDIRARPQERLGGLAPMQLQNSLSGPWARGVHPDLLALEFKRRAQSVRGPIVCPDLLRQNEADIVHALGGVIICIRRRGWVPHNLGHAARLADIQPDLTFTQEGGCDALNTLADELVAALREAAS